MAQPMNIPEDGTTSAVYLGQGSWENLHSSPRVPPRARAVIRRKDGGAIGRNEPCLCGSGKKFKRCCLARFGR